ncbi:MAG: FtsQ-type POTRA domain-containing protein, partial [Firmicutes bacterium]|nr:FtsQ-type POTRA domain-containing protein [Bacillota bacterium]
MDYNDDFRAVRGRKIQSDNEYYTQPPREENDALRTRNVSRNEIRKHHQNKQKARRLFMARVRAAVILILTITVIASVLLLTPLCDIRYVTVEGNAYVSSEEIIQSAGELTGKNLITASKNRITAGVKSN